MKKQLLMSILTAGLIGSSVQAVSIMDLADPVRNRDMGEFVDILEDCYNPKQIISEQDYIQDLQRLLASGVNLSDNLYGHDTRNYDSKFSMPAIDMLLLFSVESGQHNLVKFLLKNGANINIETPSQGCTPLAIAKENDDLAMFELLLAHGADIDIAINSIKKELKKCEQWLLENEHNKNNDLSEYSAYKSNRKWLSDRIKSFELYKKNRANK